MTAEIVDFVGLEHRSGPPELLIEVPHGADERYHYDDLAGVLSSPLPAGLEKFFFVNTDVAAWALGRHVAQAWVARNPDCRARAIRCTIPRTFVDTNRVVGECGKTGLTPGLQPWITTPEDTQRLTRLHTRYTELVRASYAEVCGAGGLAIIPHTFAPRSVPIARVDLDIVKNLEHAYAPERIEEAPLRAEIDLITETPEGEDLSPAGLADAVTARLEALGYGVQRNHAYQLHPVTMGARWARAYPGQVLCFEVRRDQVTEWVPFTEKRFRHDAIASIADALVDALVSLKRS